MCGHEGTSSLAIMRKLATLKECSSLLSAKGNPARRPRCSKIGIVSPEFPEFPCTGEDNRRQLRMLCPELESLRQLRWLIRLVTVLCALLCASYSVAAADAEVCSELSRYFGSDRESMLEDPSRTPTEAENALIDTAKIELLEWSDFARGLVIVDADNDGKEDLLVWIIQGTGRFAQGELYEFPDRNEGQTAELVLKTSIDLGVLQEPRFVRFNGVNYIVFTETGDADGLIVSQIVKTANGLYEQCTLCRMETYVTPETKCRHPACKRLAELVEDKDRNGPFVKGERPHMYFAPAGLEVFYSQDWSHGDFDNTNSPTAIWRIGRSGYIYDHIYWALLGQGEEMPEIDPELRPKSEDRIVRRVLPGSEHDRLRRTLAQQSEVLSKQLHRPISLPDQGEFFLFNAHGNRTYWAWDFGDSPSGEEIHITYTNAKKSDYIGMLRIKRTLVLKP
jgi:hypothetical protein